MCELLARVFLWFTAEGRTIYKLERHIKLKKQVAKLISGETTAEVWATETPDAAGSCCAQHLFGFIAQHLPGVTMCWGHNLFLLCLLEREDGIKQKEDWVKYIQPNSAVLELGV